MKLDLVTTQLLGETAVSKLPYKNWDGNAVRVDGDFFKNARSKQTVSGPFYRKSLADSVIALDAN